MRKLPIRLASLAQGKPKIRNSGQALLVILLIMSVALTIGLAITSRTVTDVEISGKTEEAARAFSAAEAGIEEALITATSNQGGGFPETGATFKSEVAGLGESEAEFVFSQPVSVDEIKTLYLASYGTGGTLTPSYDKDTIDLCWNDDAAIEASLYYDSSGYKVARYTVDPNGAGRTPANNFDLPDAGGCAGLDHKKTLIFPSGTPLFLRIRVLYVDTKVGVSAVTAGGVLPSQGLKIESTGTAGTSTRKVEVIRMHPAPPGIFDFLLYSGSGDLSK